MAEKLKQNALFRFRCPSCNLRLKTAIANKGRPIVCPQCKHAVVAERSPTDRMPEESIIQRLDETVDQWVRTTCSCGKLIKAPAAFAGRTGNCPQCGKTITMPEPGETISSSLEVSTLVQAPSEESLLMAVGDMDPEDKPANDTGITYNRVTPLKAEPAEEPQFVRAACYCGAEIHANPDMAGKAVRCPKCKTLLHLPKKPVARPVFDFDDMARHDLSFGGESITFKPHHISGGQNLFHEIDPSMEVVATPVTQAEWNKEKQTRALHIRTLRGAGPLETNLRVFGILISDSTNSIRNVLWGSQASQLATSGSFVAGALILFVVQYHLYWRGVDNSLPTMAATHSIQFYDITNGKLFPVTSSTLPPVAAPSQSDASQNPAGVRAYSFSCEGCSSDQEIYVGLIETMTPAAKNGWQRRMEVTGVPSVPALFDPSNTQNQGRLISKPSPLLWVDASSPEGLALIKGVLNTKCSGGQNAQWCNQ